MQYNIVASLSGETMGTALVKLECEVNVYIGLGWKPIGSVSMFEHEHQFYATQAMIKEDERYEHKRQICNQRAMSVH